MKESISVFLKRLSDILEFVISFILTAGIILLCLRVAGAIYKIPDLNVCSSMATRSMAAAR